MVACWKKNYLGAQDKRSKLLSVKPASARRGKPSGTLLFTYILMSSSRSSSSSYRSGRDDGVVGGR